MTRVQLFITCLTDSFFPQTGEAVVEIFQRLGIGVDFARKQTCCGQPQFNAGLRKDARAVAEHTIKVFENANGDIVAIGLLRPSLSAQLSGVI
jgi:L-lactate dehydrogenase complex protein LldE